MPSKRLEGKAKRSSVHVGNCEVKVYDAARLDHGEVAGLRAELQTDDESLHVGAKAGAKRAKAW